MGVQKQQCTTLQHRSADAVTHIPVGVVLTCAEDLFCVLLQVGGNFPLYGCCWYVREMLHRPPYLARQEFRSCRAPFRQCMIAAPRCYCLLSHFPFFDLHFRVSVAGAANIFIHASSCRMAL
jgi:hypothetical protein